MLRARLPATMWVPRQRPTAPRLRHPKVVRFARMAFFHVKHFIGHQGKHDTALPCTLERF
jgi:hypothetical protein